MLSFVPVSILAVLATFCGTAIANYETACGSVSEQEYASLTANINVYAKRLLSLRNDRYGWMNTPEAMIGLILSAPEQFSNIDATVAALENEVRTNGSTMTLGKLSQVLLAAKATCRNTTNFGGMDLASELKIRLEHELMLNGTERAPPQGWYGVYLAVGAYCISEGKTPGNSYVERILETQNRHGSFHDSHSVDFTAQAMLSLTCIARTSKTHDPMRVTVIHSVNRASTNLLTSLTIKRDNVWIGNKYSTPAALLALMENEKLTNQKPLCLKIFESLNQAPQITEPEAALSQALPVLKGKSVLSLMDEDRTCSFPDVSEEEEEENVVETGGGNIPLIIEVEMTIRPNHYLGGSLQHMNVSRFDVTDITKGTSLHDVMMMASQQGLMKFETKASAWGKFIVSINGRKADNTKHEYWGTEANHEALQVGIEQFKPSHGDQITFKLLKWS